jgi:hypothetical protein
MSELFIEVPVSYRQFELTAALVPTNFKQNAHTFRFALDGGFLNDPICEFEHASSQKRTATYYA